MLPCLFNILKIFKQGTIKNFHPGWVLLKLQLMSLLTLFYGEDPILECHQITGLIFK